MCLKVCALSHDWICIGLTRATFELYIQELEFRLHVEEEATNIIVKEKFVFMV